MKISEKISILDEDIDVLLNSYNSTFPEEKKTFDSRRRAIIKILNTQDFHAVAGSGKTTLLAFKLAILLQKWPYINRGICVLSHTNVAKDIILKELSKINPCLSLKTHPHFIGTIQQFVDCFMALPYIESFIGKVNIIDSDVYWRVSEMKFKYFQDTCLRTRRIFFPEYANLLEGPFNAYCARLNIRTESAKKKREEKFIQHKRRWSLVRKEIEGQGIWTYEDMYKYARELISKYPTILGNIQYRFPFVVVDEAQDTNKEQYELLEQCFFNENVIFQRMGDPDQAIYSEKSSTDISTQLFQRVAKESLINDTYRFGEKIAQETSRYTCSNIILQGRTVNDYGVKEILFPSANPSLAIEKFVNFIIENKNRLPADPIVKIIGAQGKNSANREVLTISSYVPAFNKHNGVNNFKSSNIFRSLRFVYDNIRGEFLEKYNILCFCLSNAVLMDNDKMSVSEFKAYLRDTHQERNLRQILFKWIFNECPIKKEAVEKDLSVLKGLHFDCSKLCKNDGIRIEKIEVENTISLNGTEYSVKDNKFTVDGITFCVDTIHGVKGETHDATLVLATQDNIRGESTNLKRLRGKICTTYKPQRKKLYVATSRAKYFLALAIPQDNT